MTFKALRRPRRLGRTAAQLTDARRSRRQLPGRPSSATGRLVTRWTQGPGGRPVLEWTLEHPTRHFINRKRGSDA
jgi:hypothetical protein